MLFSKQYPFYVEKAQNGALTIEENKTYYSDKLFWGMVSSITLALFVLFVVFNLTPIEQSIPWWWYAITSFITAFPIFVFYLRKKTEGKYSFDPNRKQIRHNNQVYCSFAEIESLVFDIHKSYDGEDTPSFFYHLKIGIKDSAPLLFNIEYPVYGLIILNEISLVTGIPYVYKENGIVLETLKGTGHHYIAINKVLFYRANPIFTSFKNNPIENYQY